MSSALLAFDGVTYQYPGVEEPALSDVSFEIGPGEFCLLAGLTGHGKSTLLRAACGLVPHFHGGHFAGRVRLAGLDTRDHGPADLGGYAGVLFQDPETQLVMSTVRAELALALESRGHGAAAVARGVEEVALALGIDSLLDRSSHDLSGGEKQRVALGAALAGRPRVVLLDEPTSQLDPVAGDELIGLLRRLNQEWETTIVLAEHRLERCLAAADRVIALDRGCVGCDGDPETFLAWALSDAPALRTPAAKLFALMGLQPPTGVRQARAALRARGLLRDEERSDPVDAAQPARSRTKAKARRSAKRAAALEMSSVWHELSDGPAILRGVTLRLGAGESVALMGRNGAGKSTLLRHAAGLLEPTRGRVQRAGRVALLLQNPGDYFIHEHVREEVPEAALVSAGLLGMAARNPRDLSGGERQRLALAIVAGDGDPPAVLALDEPTRGMDRDAKAILASELRRRSNEGQAVIVATHDPEFAAACADRAVLLADGRVIADGTASELLAGGWYFATETARILGGAGGALLPEQGARFLQARARAAASPAEAATSASVAAAPPARGEGAAADRPEGRAMSWPLASFVIVGLVLAIGWLAYERRRPSARMVAVVAVMAALAALGRDAFVALPDVKPITAMTLVVGYALGPLPGFTVGALGMLVSNFMLGQGPYTPWQMAAWGIVGLAGAALGRLSGQRLGRVPLALACGLSALAAKEVMNLYTWTLGASHTPAAFLAVAGQAVSYDVTDTVASFLFGMAFAPELARVLARIRVRMDVTWHDTPAASSGEHPDREAGRRALGAVSSLLVVIVAATLILGGAHASGARESLSPELAFLKSAQNPDGGFGGARGQSSSELYSGWAAMGLAAAGRDPLSLRRDGHSVLDALRAEASSLQGAGDLERTILALHACGVSVHALQGGAGVAGGDPVLKLLGFRAGDGSFGHLSNLTAFAIFALRAAGYSTANPAVRGAGGWLRRQQNDDGGFGFATRGGGSDVDDTAAVLQALVDAGIRGAAITRATAFLVRAQNLDGGFPQQTGGASNAQSTAWAIQGLIAAGREPRTLTREGSRSPLGYLATLRAPDGSVRYSRTGSQTPVWVTSQALTALAGKPLPIAPVRLHAGAASAAAAHQRAAGAGAGAGRGVASRAHVPTASQAPVRGISPEAGRRLNRLARAVGALLGTVLAPILR